MTKVFRPRLLLVAAIYSLMSDLESPENSPISRKILRGWRMATGAFGRELVNLEVAVTDVGTVGEICLSEASCSPTVPVFNPWPELLRFPYPLERSPKPSSIPAEYVFEIFPVFGRFASGRY